MKIKQSDLERWLELAEIAENISVNQIEMLEYLGKIGVHNKKDLIKKVEQ